jgi:maleamate amidohydrolase
MSDEAYKAASYGEQSIGFGDRPAIVIVDFQLGFTDPKFTLGKSPYIHAAVEKTAELLKVARAQKVPVASCRVGWGSKNDMGYWKIGCLYEGWFYDDEQTAMDPRVYDPDYDFNFWKHAPSIFFGTPLTNFLTKQCVDTVIVTGCTTSGCVRASVNDAFSYGYRVIVPHDCCGDMDEGPHEDNLRDIGLRYADITDAAAVIAHLSEGKAQIAAE